MVGMHNVLSNKVAVSKSSEMIRLRAGFKLCTKKDWNKRERNIVLLNFGGPTPLLDFLKEYTELTTKSIIDRNFQTFCPLSMAIMYSTQTTVINMNINHARMNTND